MRIAGLVQDSIVDGPGFRFAVFTQGCDKRCEGCHNPATWDSGGGEEIATSEIIRQMLSNPLTDGLTLSGGEPLQQATACVELAQAARGQNLNVWIYTGYVFEDLMQMAAVDTMVMKLLELTDVVVDGPFIIAERSLSLSFRGSRNQRIIDVPESLAKRKTTEMTLT